MPISRIKTDGIQDNAITSAKIGDTNIQTADIADGSVTSAKLDTNISVAGDLTVDTNTLHVDSANNRVGIGVTDPSQDIDLVGSSNSGVGSVRAGNTSTGTVGAFLAQAQFGTGVFGTYSSYPAVLNSSNSPMVYFDTNASGRAVFAEGITFNGDTAAVNALDDYEEGDFTPILTPGSGSYNGLTLTGKYTKIGRLVSVQMNLTITASGNAGGGATVSNLPFASVGSWNRMPNKWRENAATGACGQFTMNHGQTSGFMQNDDGSNIAHTTGRVYLINAIYYSA